MSRRRDRRGPRKRVPDGQGIVRRDQAFELWWREAGFRELRQLLLWRWDPIGVADHSFPWAEDEYDMYVRPLAELLDDGATASQVADYLDRITIEDITVGDRLAPDVAALIVAWYAESRTCHREFGDRGVRLSEAP